MPPALIPDQFSTLYALLVLFLISAGVVIYYYLLLYGKFAWNRKKAEVPAVFPPVSIVICAKNEEENLREFLPFILEQDYPDYEVVVVNDFSSDNTQDLLDDFRSKHPRLKVVNIREEGAEHLGKKYPLTMGIKAATHEWMLLTDADCRPAGKDWIKTMAASFGDKNEIVLGFGGYEKRKGFLNKLIRFDAAVIAIQYFSYALAKMPYMGVGRNLAYKKELFFRNKGFAKYYHIPSGDDDLFINRVSTWHNTSICFEPAAHTISKPKKGFGKWMRQKKRHLTTGKHYKTKHKIHLGLSFLSNWLCTITFLILTAFNYAPYLVIPVFVLKLTVQLIIFKNSFSKLVQDDLLAGSLLYDFLLVLIYPVITLSARISKIKKWN